MFGTPELLDYLPWSSHLRRHYHDGAEITGRKWFDNREVISESA